MSSSESRLVVMKFGGTSVGDTSRIKAVAKRVACHLRETNEKVIVVVSAMSGETDRLLGLGKTVAAGVEATREYNQLVTSGEQASAALTAMALQAEGVPAKSLLAYQLNLETRNAFGQNLIASINVSKLEAVLGNYEVPVVAGFQGVNHQGDITTLGRGGSDTTAVAIAAAINRHQHLKLKTKKVPTVCRCEILTDVDGVYSTSPKVCKEARKLGFVSYEEMLELARAGAKVLQTRSVSLARKFSVPLTVRTSFSDEPGTTIIEEYEGMEDAVVSAISAKTDEAKITLWNIPDVPGMASSIFGAIANANVVVDMIVQSQGAQGVTAISFTVPRDSVKDAEQAIGSSILREYPEAKVAVESDVAKLSVVGEGMRNHSGVAAQVFSILGKEGVNIEMITTSEIKISVAVKEADVDKAVCSLHRVFIENRE